MAKAVMTIEDAESGGIHVTIDFTPPKHTDESLSKAQQLALNMMLEAESIARKPNA